MFVLNLVLLLLVICFILKFVQLGEEVVLKRCMYILNFEGKLFVLLFFYYKNVNSFDVYNLF